VHSPAFFSSVVSSFQSFFWISSSCWWTVAFSSGESFVQDASTFERGTGATVEEEAADGEATVVAMVRRRTGALWRARRAAAARYMAEEEEGIVDFIY
jgi:hypothetical protein